MSASNQTPPPEWTAALQPARGRERREPLDEGILSAPSPAVDAVMAEIRALRLSVEDRLRSLNHRLDALNTDVLRLLTLQRQALDRDGTVTEGPTSSLDG